MTKRLTLASQYLVQQILAVGLAGIVASLLAACHTPPPPPTPELFELIERFLPHFDGSRERVGQPPLTRQDAEQLLAGATVERRWQQQEGQEAFTAVQPVRFGKGLAQCRVTVTALPGQATIHSVIFQLFGLTDPALAADEHHIIDAFVQRYGDAAEVDAPDTDLVWTLPQGGLVLLAAEADDPSITFALDPLSEVPADERLGHGSELRDHD